MKSIILLLTIISCLNLSAQKNDNSLQSSLNKALQVEKTQIINFQANLDPSKKVVQIKWSSSNLSDASQFIIERSNDKTDWQEVATIYGAPHKNQSTEYFHIDYNPIENVSYYRIIEKNKKGNKIASNIVPVKYINVEGVTAGMNLHPDFSDGQKIINIAFEEIFEKEILLVIRDKNGKEFYSMVIINIEDEELVAVPIEKEVPKGNYLITATSENQIYSQNIVIK